VTLFSTPYYSYQSLLPFDPPAFTIPTSGEASGDSQPTVSLAYYPLPDGNWKWVSRSWMVDMLGDGQTQYDGFEYNWMFRTNKWRSEVGALSAGGWVRRRRWVRLMMRPAQRPKEQATVGWSAENLTDLPTPLDEQGKSTRPPSVITATDDEDESVNDPELWAGDVEQDWARCHVALKKLGRDGRKLELWRRWLGSPKQPQSNGYTSSSLSPQKRWSEDSRPLPSQQQPSFHTNDTLAHESGVNPTAAAKDHVAAVLRSHGEDILRSFVYPDSRAQFVELLGENGLSSHLLGGNISSSQIVDFWSYSSSLDNLSQVDFGHGQS